MGLDRDRRSLASPPRLVYLCCLLSVTFCKTVRYRTYEEDAPGTVIGTLAEEMHVKAPGEISFRLMEQFSNSSLVRVREGDGQLSIGEEGIDRERLCGQSLQCVLAFDVVSLWQEQYRLVHVELEVRDQNDNAPVITHPVLINGSMEIGVSSKAPPDSLVAQIKARDADDGVNAELTFSFVEEPQQQPELFAINKKTGEIVLRGDLSEELGQVFKVILSVTDNGRPPLVTTATINFLVTATAPSSSHEVAKPSSWEEKALEWDIPLIVIIILAGSCTLLLVAIITIATTCNKRKKETEIKNNGPLTERIDISHLEKGMQEDSSPRGNAFEARSFPSKASFTNLAPSPPAEEVSSSETSTVNACLYEGQKRLRATNGEPYASSPNYSKESTPPVAIWKGHSFNTISAREAEKFSGKDSGKGDSDFNDSDSDISGDALKKDLITHMQNGLWACTAECKILGHSDRCWSPSCGRSNPHSSPHPSAQLSTFCKSTSLPRDPLRRDNYYQAQLPKTVGLQSVYEKVLHRDFDRTITLLSPPRSGRLPELQEMGVPLYQAPSTRYLAPQTDTSEKV
nr:protocadherin-8 [Chrysemys picta bellii]